MAISIDEVTIATKDIDQLKNFYARLIDKSDIKHNEFFYTIKDQATHAQVSIVPHNGDQKWNEPWLTLTTDDLPSAMDRLVTAGVQPEHIEKFSASNSEGLPVHGVCFRDPDGRLVMMLCKPQKNALELY
jgi:catechol 2,3-dioxygenase-like lactoylglutathione lyase family enzyme